MRLPKAFFTSLAVLLSAVLAGCGGGAEDSTQAEPNQSAAANEDREVVVYTALDRQFSEPIFEDFERETGIAVKAVYDSEAVKTVGLVNRLLAERDRPNADVFWNNEIVRSIQLKREGITQAYDSPAAANIPRTFRDPDNHWTGFAARARVICANSELIPDGDYPTGLSALTDPQWRGRAAFAKPLFGTTNTHAAAIWAIVGEEAFREFWTGALENAVMEAGNAQARDAAADGAVAWCWTDTDDAFGAIADGKPVDIVYADALPSEAERNGVMLIPNTVTLIAGAPHPEEGKALIDYLLSEKVEAKLAQSRSAQIPVRAGVPGPPELPELPANQVLDIDWEAVADALAPANEALVEMLAE
ncbi:MAG: extracellular solute-binding protein [Sumerlaeia bacterium]